MVYLQVTTDYFQINAIQWSVASAVFAGLIIFMKNWGLSTFVKKVDHEAHKDSIAKELSAITTAANTHKEQSFRDNYDLKLQMSKSQGQIDIIGNDLKHLIESVKDIKTSAGETKSDVIKAIEQMQASNKQFIDLATKNLIKKDNEK